MVGNISSTAQYNYTSQSTSSNQSGLSSTQQETISSVLSQFDGQNLSVQDATSIVNAFKEAGIQPSKELASAMEAEGFDAREVGDLAGVQGGQGPRGGGGMPPPPPPSDEEETSVSSLLDTLLSLEEEEDEDSTTSTTSSTSTFDEVMEYTSRILNLNDESKIEVMEMLEKLSSEDSQFSTEEKSNIVKNSLSQILSDSDNYNRISFYA